MLWKIRCSSLIVTIINMLEVIAAFAIVMIGTSLFQASQILVNDSGSMIEQASEHDLTGGYEVVFGLFGGMGGIFSSVVAAGMMIIAGFLILYFSISAVHGIITWNYCRKTSQRSFEKKVKILKRDGYIKLIINGIPALLVFMVTLSGINGNLMFHAVLCLLFVFVTVLSIYQIISCKRLVE